MSDSTDNPTNTNEPREGSALVRATFPFAKEDPATTWGLFAITMLAWSAAMSIALLAPIWPLRLLGSIIVGLIVVRIFIFEHDMAHGAVWRKSTAGLWITRIIGIYTLNPLPVWRETHDYHHQNNAKLVGASIGSYPVVTVRMWRFMKAKERYGYIFIRSPLNMALAYFTVFGIGMCITPFIRNPKLHWQGPLAVAVHAVALAGLTWFFSWEVAFFALLLPGMISSSAGALLFYVQHNFPDAWFADRRDWNYHAAALRSSSMFDMPGFMHWFTGNIGYHHVHHLNHKIPFYNLPAAMEAVPELQNPGRVSWSPAVLADCLRLKLWNPKNNDWVRWGAEPSA